MEQGRIASIVTAPSSDCGQASGGAAVEDRFETVCGVVLKDGPKLFCEALEVAANLDQRSARTLNQTDRTRSTGQMTIRSTRMLASGVFHRTSHSHAA